MTKDIEDAAVRWTGRDTLSPNRTMDQSFGDLNFNVMDFGALGDGTNETNGTNDTAAIQRAVSHVVSRGGGTLWFPPKIFRVESSAIAGVSPGAVSFGAYYQTWSSSYTYTTIYNVYRATTGLLYKSAQNGNLNHDPDGDDGTWWTPISPPLGTHSVCLRGMGATGVQYMGTWIVGNFAGFIFDRADHNATMQALEISHMNIKNGSASGGCVRLMGTTGSSVHHNYIQGHIGIQMGGSAQSGGTMLPDNTVAAPGPNPSTASSVFTTTAYSNEMLGLSAGASGTPEGGSCGIIMGMHACAYSNGIAQFEHGIRGYGTGSRISTNRIEVNTAGILLGVDASGYGGQAKGYLVDSNSLESNWDGIFCYSIAGCTFLSNVIHASTNNSLGTNCRSDLRLQTIGIGNVLIGNIFGDEIGGAALTEGAIWREYDGNCILLFIGCHCDSYVSDSTHPDYQTVIRHIECSGVFPDRRITFAGLPDGTTAYPWFGDKFIVTDGAKSGGGTAVIGDATQGSGAQTLEVVYCGGLPGSPVWKCTFVF